MVKKIKKFVDGGYTGDDPIVKYRMGITDKPKDEYKDNAPYKSDDQGLAPITKAESKAEQKVETETKQGQNKMIDDATRKLALYKNAPRFIAKGNPKSITSDRLVRKDILNEFPNSKSGELVYRTDYDDAGYKKGGKVKSASARADGCAIRGKTRA